MEVSVIIVNYNTGNLVKECVESILKKTEEVKYEIIIVDNNSQDDSKKILNYLKGDNIKIIYSEENLGFGRANNLGLKNTKGKYIFFLNPDTLLKNNAIKILIENFKNIKNCGGVGGNLFDRNNEPTHSFKMKFPSVEKELELSYRFLNKWIKRKKIEKNEKEFNETKEPLEVAYICGADFLTSKEILEEVGSFDPKFFMFFEETELAYRIKKYGYKIFSIPEAEIIHLEGQSFEFKESRFKMYTESKYMFFSKIYEESEVKKLYIAERNMYIYKLITRFKIKYYKMYLLTKSSYEKLY